MSQGRVSGVRNQKGVKVGREKIVRIPEGTVRSREGVVRIPEEVRRREEAGLGEVVRILGEVVRILEEAVRILGGVRFRLGVRIPGEVVRIPEGVVRIQTNLRIREEATILIDLQEETVRNPRDPQLLTAVTNLADPITVKILPEQTPQILDIPHEVRIPADQTEAAAEILDTPATIPQTPVTAAAKAAPEVAEAMKFWILIRIPTRVPPGRL